MLAWLSVVRPTSLRGIAVFESLRRFLEESEDMAVLYPDSWVAWLACVLVVPSFPVVPSSLISHQAGTGVPSVVKKNPEDNPTACSQQ